MSDTSGVKTKQCCAAFYGSELARFLLGGSFHPGGMALTSRLGELIRLGSDARVLDVAAGLGASAFHIAKSFGCRVVGIDLSEENIRLATEEATIRRLSQRVSFQLADSEKLPFDGSRFDAIFCECAFCTFPDKETAAGEFWRVLTPGGRLAFSDLTKTTEPLPELDGLLSWVACIGDAQPVQKYIEILVRAKFTVVQVEDQRPALMRMVREIQGRLLGVEIAARLNQVGFGFAELNLSDAKRFVQTALAAIADQKLGYTAITAVKGR